MPCVCVCVYVCFKGIAKKVKMVMLYRRYCCRSAASLLLNSLVAIISQYPSRLPTWPTSTDINHTKETLTICSLGTLVFVHIPNHVNITERKVV